MIFVVLDFYYALIYNTSIMGKMRLALTGVLFWAMMVFSLYFLTNAPVIANLESFDTLSFTMLTIIIGVIAFYFYFIEHFINKMKVDIVLTVVFLILLGCGLFVIWSTKDNTIIKEYGTGIETTVITGFKEKLRNTIQFSIALMMCYTLCFPACRRYFSLKKFRWFIYIVIIFTFVSIIASLAMEIDCYIDFFKKQEIQSCKSFYQHKNTYGFGLLLGILACASLNIRKGRWWSYLSMIIFFAAMFFTSCTTSFLISAVFLLIYLFAEIICHIRTKPLSGTLYLVLYIVSISCIFIFYAIGKSNSLNAFSTYAEFLDTRVFGKDFDTFTSRSTAWDESMALIKDDPIHLLFGRGYGFVEQYLLATSGNAETVIRTAHSGYIQILITYGIVGLTIYCLALLYFLYVLIRLIKLKQTKMALYSFLMFLAIVAHSVTESSYFFQMSFDGVVATFMILLPPLVVYKQHKHPRLKNYLLLTPVLKGGVSKINMVRLLSAIIVAGLVATSLLFVTKYPTYNPYLKEALYMILLFGGISLIFIPYIASLIYYRSSNKTFIYLIIALLVIMVAVIVFVSYMVWYYCGQTYKQVMITAPLVYVGMCLIYLAFLMPIFRSGLSYWFKNLLIGTFITPSGGLLVLVLTEALPLLFLSYQDKLNDLSLGLVIAGGLTSFLLTFLLFPFKSNRQILRNLNDSMIFTLKRDAINTEI